MQRKGPGMTNIDAISVTWLVFAVILLIRNAMVARFHMRRLSEIRARHEAMIDAGGWSDECLKEYDIPVQQVRAVFDLRKWTYRQFFPEVKHESQ